MRIWVKCTGGHETVIEAGIRYGGYHCVVDSDWMGEGDEDGVAPLRCPCAAPVADIRVEEPWA